MTTSATARTRAHNSDARHKWKITGARLVPFDTEWGVAYTFANGNSWSYRVGTREAAAHELMQTGTLIDPPHANLAPLDARIHLALTRVLEDLAASEISVVIANFGGRGFDVRLGNSAHGIVARKRFANHALDRAPTWLAAEARKHFPESTFARRYAIYPLS